MYRHFSIFLLKCYCVFVHANTPGGTIRMGTSADIAPTLDDLVVTAAEGCPEDVIRAAMTITALHYSDETLLGMIHRKDERFRIGLARIITCTISEADSTDDMTPAPMFVTDGMWFFVLQAIAKKEVRPKDWSEIDSLLSELGLCNDSTEANIAQAGEILAMMQAASE